MSSEVNSLQMEERNHYAGHGPATAKLFMDLWDKKQ
jgi:hypothetical protein